MKVKDLLKYKGYEVESVSPDTNVCLVLKTMNQKRIGSVMVLDDEGKIAGILTERDLLYCRDSETEFTKMSVRDLMTPADKLIVGSPEDTLQYAMAMMTEHRIKHIPILENGTLAGIVSIGDVVKAIMDKSVQQTKRLQDYLSGTYPEE